MFKKIAIISLFLFLPLFSYASDNRLLDQYDEWKAEQDKKTTVTQPNKTEQENGQPILYRNDDYKFRINFPAGWEIKDGDGAHVVKKAVKDGCTVLVLVKDSQEEIKTLSAEERNELNFIEFSDFSDEEANQLLDDIIKENEVAFPGSKIIEKGIRYIDNRKAGYYKVSTPYKVANVEAKVVAVNYFTIHKGKFYQIIGSYPIEPVSEQNKEPVINASLMTFVFEDWGDTENIQNQASTNSMSKWSDVFGGNLNGWEIFLAIIIGILFTWVLGLAIPLLLRFVILKRPLSKSLSLLVVGIVFIIQALASVAIANDNKSRISMSLYLVAYIGYLTLRKGLKASEVRYCKECGNKIHASATICNKCGKEIISK